MPCRAGGLVAVIRVLLSDAFAMAHDTIVVDGHQHELAGIGTAEAGFEEMNERESQQPQFEAIDLHRHER